MDISNWFNLMIPESQDRIRSAILRNLESFAEKGTQNSTSAFFSIMNAGFDTLNNEIILLIDKISKIYISNANWNKVEKRLTNYLQEGFKNIINDSLLNRGFDIEQLNRFGFTTKFDERINECKGNLEIFITYHKRDNWDKTKRRIGAVFMVIFAAVIGAIVTRYIFPTP